MGRCKTSLSDVFVFQCHAVHEEEALALVSGVLLFKHLLNTYLFEAPCKAYTNNLVVWSFTLKSLLSQGRKCCKQAITTQCITA